jgi:protein-disulfide isomerase
VAILRKLRRFEKTVILSVLLGACVAPSPPIADGTVNSSKQVGESETAPESKRLNAPGPTPEPSEPIVNIADDFRMGKRDAAIGVLEFSDFQCPYCRDFHNSLLPQLQETYINTGIVQYIYKDFPLRMHREAVPAALAAGCAGAQEQYWLMHDRLFANQEHLGNSLYVKLARDLNLDVERFEACMRDRAQVLRVNRDVMQGRQLGVSATPTIMLGRVDGDYFTVLRIAKGVPNIETFVREIEKLRGDR